MVNSSAFSSNQADIGAAIVVEGVTKETITIANSSFTDNRATAALVKLSQGSMNVTSCQFTNNIAELETHGFSLQAGASLIFERNTINAGGRRMQTYFQ